MRSFEKPIVGAALGAALVLLAPCARADGGEKIFQETCGACHDAKTRPLDAVRQTRAQWKDTVEKMEGLGAQIPSGQKLTELLDWLERTHGPGSPPPADKK
jgi:cytochrome c5